MFDAVIDSFFLRWFNSKEKELSCNADWSPPAESDPTYEAYALRKQIAWAAWVARGDYPLMTKKAISLPEEMYIFLAKVRQARQSEIDNVRPPAIQRDLTISAVRCLGDYLIRYDIAGSR